MTQPTAVHASENLFSLAGQMARATVARAVVGGLLARMFTNLTFTSGAIIGGSIMPITVVTALA